MFGRLKLKLLRWLLRDICKQDQCTTCRFCKLYRDKPMVCLRDDAEILHQARTAWKVKETKKAKK